MKLRATRVALGIALAAASAFFAPSSVYAGERTLYVTSAVENRDGTVTLPVYRGLSKGRTVWYIVLDSSDGEDAKRRGVNRSSKLSNAKASAAVQRVTIVNGVIHFPASVDFTPNRVVVPGPGGFPPLAAEPGSVGEAGYSPLIRLPNGVVLNAPQIANASGQADKVVRLDLATGKVKFELTDGFSGGKAVKYISTDASDRGAAALEGVTYAPALDAAPAPGGDGSDAARASLAAFVNGQTGANNPNRQGLNSALLDGLAPLNILRWTPNQGRYSPLWDVHFAAWSPAAISAGANTRQTDWGDVAGLASKGIVSGPGGAPFAPAGVVVNCPIISAD